MAVLKSSMGKKNVMITGATGMIGGLTLQFCLNDPDVARVTVIGRRTTEIEHPKLCEVLHDDFVGFASAADFFDDQDVAFYCLGAYTGAVPDDTFRRITVDYTLAFASVLYQKSPGAAFCFLSGQGADPTGKSRVAFARYKGKAENGLLATGFPRVHIFRPGYVYPVTPRREPNLMYTISRFLYPLLQRIYPNIGIPSDDLAAAMAHVGLHGNGAHGTPILENRDIRLMVKSI